MSVTEKITEVATTQVVNSDPMNKLIEKFSEYGLAALEKLDDATLAGLKIILFGMRIEAFISLSIGLIALSYTVLAYKQILIGVEMTLERVTEDTGFIKILFFAFSGLVSIVVTCVMLISKTTWVQVISPEYVLLKSLLGM